MDAIRLDQVLENLISNAIKYSPDGGPIVLSVTHDADMHVLAIADNGIGLPSGWADVLFEPFGRASNAQTEFPGTGLGLYIARSIVESHGGTIRASSRGPGMGATLTLTLPAIDAPQSTTPETQRTHNVIR